MGVSLGLPAGCGGVTWPTCWQWACPLAYLLAVGVTLGLPAGSGRFSWPTFWQWAYLFDLPAGCGRVILTYLLAVGVSPGLPAGSGRVP